MPATAAARRTPRSQHTGDKHDLILKAATKLFARRGFFNAQVADVAREAGVAAGTVDALMDDIDKAAVDDRLKPILHYAGKLTRQPAGLTQADADAWAEDLHDLGRSGNYFFSLNRYLFVAEKG